MKKFFKNVALVATMLFAGVVAYAQMTTSAVNGRIVDENGDPLAGAVVLLVHTPSGSQYYAVANNDGRYTIEGVRPGADFTIEVSFLGCQTVKYTDVTLNLGETYKQDVTLSSGEQLAEAVLVVSATHFTTEKTGASTNISSRQITSMPMINRSISDVYSYAAQNQGSVLYDYILGLYDFLERLTQRYPDMLIEGCSGGGGRFDAGMLYYTPQIWCSDNTDPIDRLRIQYGTSFGYPACTMGAHVSVSPNEQDGRVTPLSTRGITAMSGTFGYELNPEKLSAEEKEEIRRQILDLYVAFEDADPKYSKVFPTSEFGYWEVPVYTPRIDENGQPVLDKKGKPVKPDTDKEIVPFTYVGGIDAFMKNEVLPFSPLAYRKPGTEKIGYEISFTKYFYQPVQLRTLDEISADIRAIEAETDGMLNEILKD